MSIDDAISELSAAADARGVSYETRTDREWPTQKGRFELWPYTIELSLNEDGSVHWWVGAVVGGRYIGDQSGEFTEGDGTSLVSDYAP